jgi:hypothetical protein
VSFRVIDFRDTDIMSKLDQLGTISSVELASELGASKDEGAKAIGRRLGWMRRYGMVELDPEKRVWTISPGGTRVLESRRVAAAKKAIEKLPREELVEVMAHITSVYRLGDPMLAAMLRREFQYGTAPQSRAWGR